jgi:hypothetical protein
MSTATKKTNKTSKPKRLPIHSHRDILTVANLPDDKHGRWVLDRENRIQIFQEAGYNFVTSKGLVVGDRKVDGTQEVGDIVCIRGTDDGARLYLMAIDKELFEEDQLYKSQKLDAVDQELQANVVSKDRVL